MDEATVEDRVREADRVDPDVDHRSEDYQPETPAPATRTSPDRAADRAGAGSATQPVAEPGTEPHNEPRTEPDAASGGSHRA